MRRGEFAAIVATRVREARLAIGASTRELADLAGVTNVDVRRLERASATVDALVLSAVVTALGIDLDDVIPFRKWRAASSEASHVESTTTENGVAPENDAMADASNSTRVRAKTISQREMLRERRLEDLVDPEDTEVDRPRTRAECVSGPRPCPFVSCRHHLYLDVTPAGSLKFNHPAKEVDELEETCALDVADRGGTSLQEIADLLNITRQGAQLIENVALRHARPAARRSDLKLTEAEWSPADPELHAGKLVRR